MEWFSELSRSDPIAAMIGMVITAIVCGATIVTFFYLCHLTVVRCLQTLRTILRGYPPVVPETPESFCRNCPCASCQKRIADEVKVVNLEKKEPDGSEQSSST